MGKLTLDELKQKILNNIISAELFNLTTSTISYSGNKIINYVYAADDNNAAKFVLLIEPLTLAEIQAFLSINALHLKLNKNREKDDHRERVVFFPIIDKYDKIIGYLELRYINGDNNFTGVYMRPHGVANNGLILPHCSNMQYLNLTFNQGRIDDTFYQNCANEFALRNIETYTFNPDIFKLKKAHHLQHAKIALFFTVVFTLAFAASLSIYTGDTHWIKVLGDLAEGCGESDLLDYDKYTDTTKGVHWAFVGISGVGTLAGSGTTAYQGYKLKSG